jgi:Flp pilus assembly protein TadD
MTLLVLSGCAGGSASVQNLEIGASQTAAVARLEEGRTGFVVSENYQYDEDLGAHFKRGLDALNSAKYKVAVHSFRTITKKAPFQSPAYINLAIAHIRNGSDEQAEEPLKKALVLVAGHPLASHEYGLLLRRAGRFDEARAVYEVSLKRFPEYYPLRKNLGVLCDLYLNDLDCAASQYGMFLEAQPDNAQVKLWLVELQGR